MLTNSIETYWKRMIHGYDNDSHYMLIWNQRFMDEAIAMQIVGAVCLLIGMKMNIDPKGFNEDIFGKEAHESALGEMNAMRMAIGGGVLAISAINLICSFTMDDASSMAALLTASAVGLALFCITIVGANLRGYTESIPKLPMIVLPILVTVSLVGAYF